MGLVRRGSKWCIRYYGPDGRQHWETIGPNKKEAETVLHQRLYEVRSGIFPILRRRSQITFEKLAKEWFESYAKAHVRPSTLTTYRWLLDYHLLPAFGARALTTLTAKDIQAYLAEKVQQVAPKTANHGLVPLKEILEAAVAWGRIPTNPAKQIRKVAVPRRDARLWTTADIHRFLLAADDMWRPVFLAAVFTGLRLGELQAMAWDSQNRPNFTTNKIEVTCSYNDRTRRLGPAKSERSVRTVDMTPSVRQTLLALRQSATSPFVFPGEGGGPMPPSVLARAFHATIKRAGIARIRFHDLRHTFASLLIMAGKHPKYICSQMGHHSAAFTLDTYGHLMDRLPVRPVEWIDDLVFPQGATAALKLHSEGAPSAAIAGHAVQSPEWLKASKDAGSGNLVQSGTTGCVVGGAGLEPAASSV